MDGTKEIWLVASGDLRLSANQDCWPAQENMERKLIKVLESFNCKVKRAHKYDEKEKHGFIKSQRMGIEVFKKIPEKAPLIVAESVWQYTHHVLPGLMTHSGPILTVANWDGQWPGLVGMLNLNGSLTKAEVKYSTLWSENFEDGFFLDGIQQWLKSGYIQHDCQHVKAYQLTKIPHEEDTFAKEFATTFRKEKAIIGIFDEGCMGMFNAIVPDHLLHRLGIFKERLSQSALYARMLTVREEEAEKVLQWLLNKGLRFKWGEMDEDELTRKQTLEQCKMYIATVRIAHDFGLDATGIQYQQGLKDLTIASDLVEGLLNSTERPPVYSDEGMELFEESAIPNCNEVDECAGIDALITYKLWQKLGMNGDNTLHDIRWGEHYTGGGIDDFVWTFMISGAIPVSHVLGGYAHAESWRQGKMFFKKGGGTLRGVSKPGSIVWSRIYIENDRLKADIGTGNAVALPEEETRRRWMLTNEEWPIMHAVLDGVNRDQLMARHQANHIHVVYANDKAIAQKACRIKAAVFHHLGIETHFCGEINLTDNE